MYIDTWETFYEQAEELYRANPLRTRYVVKYRHCDGKLSVKVTDDNVVRPAARRSRAAAARRPGPGKAAIAPPPRSACNIRQTSRQT
jgi:hypothetical protein